MRLFFLPEAPLETSPGQRAFPAQTWKDSVSAHPTLEADRIACVEGCGNLNPVFCLSPERAAIAQTLTFPGGTVRLPRSLAYDGGPGSEHIDLVRRQLHAGTVTRSETLKLLAGSMFSPSAVLACSEKSGREARLQKLPRLRQSAAILAQDL